MTTFIAASGSIQSRQAGLLYGYPPDAAFFVEVGYDKYQCKRRCVS